jgi:hypothetical protein
MSKHAPYHKYVVLILAVRSQGQQRRRLGGRKQAGRTCPETQH